MEKFDFIDSKFRLAILAAKRAKQLVSGARKKVDTQAENPLSVALQEIYQGKVKYRILDEHEQIMYNEESPSMLLKTEEEERQNHSIGEEYMYEDKDNDKFNHRNEDSYDEGYKDKYEVDDDSESNQEEDS